MEKLYTGYYRVSTQKQGISGLGLEPQKAAVKNFIHGKGITEELQEILAEIKEQAKERYKEWTFSVA